VGLPQQTRIAYQTISSCKPPVLRPCFYLGHGATYSPSWTNPDSRYSPRVQRGFNRATLMVQVGLNSHSFPPGDTFRVKIISDDLAFVEDISNISIDLFRVEAERNQFAFVWCRRQLLAPIGLTRWGAVRSENGPSGLSLVGSRPCQILSAQGCSNWHAGLPNVP
jgi:hypothetical protein